MSREKILAGLKNAKDLQELTKWLNKAYEHDNSKDNLDQDTIILFKLDGVLPSWAIQYDDYKPMVGDKRRPESGAFTYYRIGLDKPWQEK